MFLNSIRLFIWLLLYALSLAAFAHDSTTHGTRTVKLIQGSNFLSSDVYQFLPINSKTLQLKLSDCPKVFSEATKNTGRRVMESVLICNALKQSGNFSHIKYVISGNTNRQKLDLVHNKGDMLGHSSAELSLNNGSFYSAQDFAVSHTVIKQSQSKMWLFTSKNQLSSVQKKLRTGQLASLIGVTMLSWRSNIEAMSNLGLTSIRLLTDQNNIARTLINRRAHITAFPIDKDVIKARGALHRIKDYQLDATCDRLFAMNKNSPLVAQAINKYLSALRRSNDQLTIAFQHASAIIKPPGEWY